MILPTFMHSKHSGGHFHEDWTINPYRIKCQPPDIVTKNLLTKFLENQTINSVNKVLLNKSTALREGGCGGVVIISKNAPLPNAHVFQPTTNVLTKFHDDRTINVAS
ncbi:hypothetical protein DPMN_171945 [Dreissena polymorpha]|uniref:Uncharacterized protein n=1 Tax=Dreissena polymorpha TaxID=45954 RepID=A0A9D4E0N2_DREPO|nr:hypothetical protein DPMN_171945 [Dreissena polymorpha]